MDSQEYFARAEKANRTYRRAVIGLLVILILVLGGSGAAVFVVNERNHSDSEKVQKTIIQNEVKLNQNQDSALQCVLDLTPTTYSPPAIHQCFATNNNLVIPKGN